MIRPRPQGIELRHMAALVAIADEGTFHAAANRLGYVQSAVSQQIAALERTVGQRLVDRSSSSAGASVTAAGEVLLPHFRLILARVSLAMSELEAEAGYDRLVRVAMVPGLEAQLVPRVLPRLAHEHELELRVMTCRSEEIDAALAEGRADAALVETELRNSRLVDHRLLEDPVMLLVSAASLLDRRGSPPTDAELAELPFIGQPGSDAHERAHAALVVRGIDPHIVHDTQDEATVRALVARGVGVAIVPALSIAWDDASLAAVPLDGLVDARVLSLVWPADRDLRPPVEAFCDTTIAVCRKLQRELDRRVAATRPAAVAS